MRLNNLIIIAIFAVPLFLFFYMNSTVKSYATTEIITNKPQIIKFSSSMCGECKKTDKELRPLYEKYKKDIVINDIHTDVRSNYNYDLMKKYRVNVVPTIVILKKDNTIYKRLEGFCDYTTMESYIKEILKW